MSSPTSRAPAKDTKPDLAALAGQDMIDLIVRNENGGEVHYKIKKTSKLRKLEVAYAKHFNLNPKHIRLIFDEERIGDLDTAKELEMEDGNILNVEL